MFNISDYLKKFSNYKKKEAEVVGCFKKITKENNIDLSNNKVFYKNNTVEVFASNTIKNMIFIKKNKLLDQLKTAGFDCVKDIV